MLKNLPLKIFAFLLAAIFWVVIVSLENTYFQFPEEISVQVFNQAPDLALTGKLGAVKLGIRASDQAVLRSLSASDFEAYVDLRNSGAGKSRVPVSVTPRNPQVSVVKIEPNMMEIELEPVRQKAVPVVLETEGAPAKGFRVESVKLSQNTITVLGAGSFLKKIAAAKAHVKLQGNEKRNMAKRAEVVLYDASGAVLEGLAIEQDGLSADFVIVEVEGLKEVGVKVKIIGAVVNGVVKKIAVDPAVVSIAGPREVLEQVKIVETEQIDLKDAAASFEKKVKLVLPKGVSLAEGQAGDAIVKVEIEKAVP